MSFRRIFETFEIVDKHLGQISECYVICHLIAPSLARIQNFGVYIMQAFRDF